MSSPNTRSSSSTLLVVIVVALAALALFAPGILVFPHLLGMHPWRLFAPLGLMSILQLALAVWVGVDAERRCGQGVLWGLLVFFTSVIGLIVYLIVCPMAERRRIEGSRAGARCPSCSAAIESDFKVCPYCGQRLGGSCPSCAKPVRADWQLCPECGAKLQ